MTTPPPDPDSRTRWLVADVAAQLGVTPATVLAYRSRHQMPPADGILGRTPWWWPDTITSWHAGRPGPGRRGRRGTEDNT